MDEFDQLELARLKCFKECEEETPRDAFSSEDSKLQFFSRAIQRASCIQRCEEGALGLLPWGGVSHYVLDQLNRKEGHNYLQMALYKVGKWGG